MKTEWLEEIKAFVAEEWYEPKDGLSADTSVNLDLGMAGDDGVEFMQAFGQRFGVDLSLFPHDKYFGPEAAVNPASVIEGIIRWVRTGRLTALTPMRLSALAEAAEQGRWVDELQREI